MNNGAMGVTEIIIWSCLLGGLLTLSCGAVGEILSDNNPGAWRALSYVLVLGGSGVVGSGLPLALFPDLSPQTLQTVQSIISPLSGALVLWYLGVWLGVALVDRMLYVTINWGAAAMVSVAALQALIGLGLISTGSLNPLWISAVVCTTGVLFALHASVRAYRLGDDLARWMAVACGFLAVMVVGLYTCALWPTAIPVGGKAVIALCALVHFLMGIRLSMRRNQANSRLKRRASDTVGFDRATGLPTGSVLLTKVDDALWRAERAGVGCAVVALHLRNLYSMSESAGHAIDQQILTAVAARVRRAVGFRYVVGLYHPRCFVVVITSDKLTEATLEVVTRLRATVPMPLTVMDAKQAYLPFAPQVGMGVVTLEPDGVTPMEVINQAERRALASVGEQHPMSEHDIATTPAALE